MTSAAVQQMWMNVSEDREPVDEVNDTVLASSLEALPSPTDAGVDRKSHVRECGLHTVVDGSLGLKSKMEFSTSALDWCW